MTRLITSVPYASLLSPAYHQRVAEENARKIRVALETAVEWSDDLKFRHLLAVNGASLQRRIDQHTLFPVKTAKHPSAFLEDSPGEGVIQSPCGDWRYGHALVPRGSALNLVVGGDQGHVVMDTDVVVPQLWRNDRGRWGGGDQAPIMSLTPQEILSLNRGNRFAKGHTIVGGLGLGWQLVQVCKRKQVKRVTVVEVSQGLIDWLGPRILPLCNGKQVDFVQGRVEDVCCGMEADAALIDTFASFSNRADERESYRRKWPGVKNVWCWSTTAG